MAYRDLLGLYGAIGEQGGSDSIYEYMWSVIRSGRGGGGGFRSSGGWTGGNWQYVTTEHDVHGGGEYNGKYIEEKTGTITIGQWVFVPEEGTNSFQMTDGHDQRQGGGGGADNYVEKFDQYGLKVNFGIGLGFKTPFGSAMIKLPNANIYKRSIDRNGIVDKQPDLGVTIMEASFSIPLINLGGNLKLKTREPFFELNSTFLGWNYGSEGLLINNSVGFHFGIIGVELYQKTNDFNGYINAYPNARQNFYEKTGVPMPWR